MYNAKIRKRLKSDNFSTHLLTVLTKDDITSLQRIISDFCIRVCLTPPTVVRPGENIGCFPDSYICQLRCQTLGYRNQK